MNGNKQKFSYFFRMASNCRPKQEVTENQENDDAANGTEMKPAEHELKGTAKPTVKQTKRVREKEEITS